MRIWRPFASVRGSKRTLSKTSNGREYIRTPVTVNKTILAGFLLNLRPRIRYLLRALRSKFLDVVGKASSQLPVLVLVILFAWPRFGWL